MPYARSSESLALSLVLASMLACGRDGGRTGNQLPERPPDHTAVPEATRPAESPPTAAEASPPRDAGTISIVFSSDDGGALGEFIATLLIADPNGRRTGHDAASGVTLAEIPNGWYDDEVIEDPEDEGSGAAARTIEITSPEPGAYTLMVHATGRGTYDLSIRGYNSKLEASEREFTDVSIEPGDVHSYVVTFDPGSGISARSQEQ